MWSYFRNSFETNDDSFFDHYLRWKQVPTHTSREANYGHSQAPCQLPKYHLPWQLSEYRVDLYSSDHCLRDAGIIHTPHRRNCTCQKQKLPIDVSLPWHQRWAPRNLKPTAPHKVSTYKNPGLSQDLVIETFAKAKEVSSIHKASIPSSSQGEPVLHFRLHEGGETCLLPNNKVNSARASLLLQAQNQIVHHKAFAKTC